MNTKCICCNETANVFKSGYWFCERCWNKILEEIKAKKEIDEEYRRGV